MEDVTGRLSQDSLAHLAPRPPPEAQHVPLPPDDQREYVGEGLTHHRVDQSPVRDNSEHEVDNMTRVLEEQGALLNPPEPPAPLISFTPTGAMTTDGIRPRT